MHLDFGVLNALVDDCDYRLRLDFQQVRFTFVQYILLLALRSGSFTSNIYHN